MKPPATPTLMDLEHAVELAWGDYERMPSFPRPPVHVLSAVREYVAARKEARKSGRRTVVLSQKTVQEIRGWDASRFTPANESLKRRVFDLVIEDVLGTVLQEDDR